MQRMAARRQTVRRVRTIVLPEVRPHRRFLAGGVAAAVCGAVLSLAIPGIVGGAIDALAGGVSSRVVLRAVGLVLAVAAAQALAGLGQRGLMAVYANRLEHGLRRRLFRHLVRLPAPAVARRTVGDLIARTTSDVTTVRAAAGFGVMHGVTTAVVIVAAMALMARIDAGLTAVMLLGLPVLSVVTLVFSRRLRESQRVMQEEIGVLTSRLQQHLTGLRVIRAFTAERWEVAAFEGAADRYVGAVRRLLRLSAAFHPLLQFVVGAGFVLFLAVGGWKVLSGRLTLGQFVAFNLYIGRMIWPMVAMGWIVALFSRASASLERLDEVLGEPAEVEEGGRGVPAGRGAVRIEGLTFVHPGSARPVLVDVALEVPAGGTVAIVGPAGSGKTTLLRLIPRLWAPPPGTIRVDGVDVLDWPLEALRERVALVPQEPFVFSGTVRANVTLERPGATDDEVWRVIRATGLDGDVERFPDGLDTVIGERGVTLSGGQRQRLALARALLGGAPLLLLDDCLSAVDSRTEARILAGLADVREGRGVLIATHRLSVAQLAEEIVVMREGRVVQRGSHDVLFREEGLYRELVLVQRLEEG